MIAPGFANLAVSRLRLRARLLFCAVGPGISIAVLVREPSLIADACGAASAHCLKQATATFAVLQRNGELLIVDQRTGRTVREIRFGPQGAFSAPLDGSHALTKARNDRSLFVLLNAVIGGSAIGVVHFPSLTYTTIRADDSSSYTAIIADPSSGLVYVAGGTRGRVRILAIDPATRIIQRRWLLPKTDHNWAVYQIALNDRGTRLYLSYHSSSATGLDWLSLTDDQLHHCQSQERPYCPRGVHGGFQPVESELLAATGGPLIARVDSSGVTTGSIDTQLSGVHLMEFAIEPRFSRIFVVGSCGYVSAFVEVPLISANQRSQPRNGLKRPDALQHVCGERLAIDLKSRTLAVASGNMGPPGAINAIGGGGLQIIDLVRSQLIANVHTPSEAVDVIALSVR